jgi:hypothetical protein
MQNVVSMMARPVDTNTGFSRAIPFESEILVSRQAKPFALARQLRRTCLPAILGDTRRYILFVPLSRA